MRILKISKRFYTGKDLLRDRYGRVYAFSEQLARSGCQVHGVALGYRSGGCGDEIRQRHDNGALVWEGYGLGCGSGRGLMGYLRRIEHLCDGFRPDVVFSASDCFNVIWGGRLAERIGCPHVADLYDNFESFGASKVPGVRSLFRSALKRADLIICVSRSLADYVKATCRLPVHPQVITNAVDVDQFRPLDKRHCRQQLNLPGDRLLVGTGGALSRNRGIETILAGFQQLQNNHQGMDLVLAGPLGRGVRIPKNDRIHYLGELPYAKMQFLFNALDVGVISNLDSAFGRYCFPQKFHEMVACRLPIVAASVGDLPDLMRTCQEALFAPGSVDRFQEALEYQLANQCLVPESALSWQKQGEKLATLLDRFR